MSTVSSEKSIDRLRGKNLLALSKKDLESLEFFLYDIHHSELSKDVSCQETEFMKLFFPRWSNSYDRYLTTLRKILNHSEFFLRPHKSFLAIQSKDNFIVVQHDEIVEY